MEGVLPCNLSLYNPRTLHIVNNTSHAFKVKQDTLLHFYRYSMHQGLPCSKEKLGYAMLHKVVPQAPLQWPPSPAESLLR
jgi:hypothetical protein